MEIVSTQTKIYKPEFNPENDNYYDKSPFKKYERGIPHKCNCKIGKLFNNLTQYNQHINTKTHKNYIQNYKNHNQELDTLKEEIKELTAKNEFLIRKNIDFQKELDELKSKIYELENEEGYQSC
tara:strand:- start:1024 stop:1395 length:372 start_codon:yes stop_codon:yes gene_type:complete